MRVLLKLVLDCEPDAAWHAVRSPAVFREVSAPFTTFQSLEPGGFPNMWDAGPHPVSGRAFGIAPLGTQLIDVSFHTKPGGVRLLRDSGGGTSGMLATITTWQHTMAVSPAGEGRTLYRDQLIFDAGSTTPIITPAVWAFWQWRAHRLRQLAPTWAA